MKNNKIFLFTNILPPYRARFLNVLNTELQKTGSQFEIYLSQASEPGRNWNETYPNLSLHTQKTLTLRKIWTHPHGFQEPNYIHFPLDTFSILYKNKPTHIISAELGFRTFLAAVFRAVFRETRLIVWATLSEHTEKGRSWLRTLLRKIILSSVDQVIVNGKSGKRYIENLGVLDSKVKIIPQTTDLSAMLQIKRTPFTKQISSESTPIRFLYSGRLIELKGILPWIENLNAFLKTSPEFFVELAFLGDGPLREQIQQAPRAPNLCFKFHGEVQYQDLPKYYGSADLLVLPTLSDEWGMVVVEALAAGIPVLGSIYSQAVDDLIKHGSNGWRFDPLNPQSIFESLQLIETQIEEDQWPTVEGIRSSIENLTPAKMVERFISIFEKEQP